MSNNPGRVPKSCETFKDFFEVWLCRQRDFLLQLEDSNHNNKGQLIQQMLSHFGEYYEEKHKVMRQDVFHLFSPPWLTSFEKAFLWAGGFRPSLAFCLVEASVSNMVPEQVEKLGSLKAEIELEERKVMDSLAEVQESMASPALAELTSNWNRLVDGEVSDFDEAIEELKRTMMRVVQRADDLRRTTVLKMAEILDVDQIVKFLAADAKYHLGIRAWGVENDRLRE